MRFSFMPRSPEDKGFTLIEVLFTIGILAMVMVAMTPFVRTVYTTWNIGDRKTELQQNGRVGLEMMSRFLRQAKRITGIPISGSGNFIKFRDALDTQTVIFYHNIPASAYYIGTSGLIKENDLVMRTIDINGTENNALLAKSLNNFQIDFKDAAGGLVTKPYEASYLDISMNLFDPEGLIPDTIEVFSNIFIRSEVRINKAVWVAAGNYVVEVSQDNWLSGFLSPNSVSVNPSTGECWVADTNNNRVKKLSSAGTILADVSGFSSPQSVSVNSTTGECWVADAGNNNRIKKLSATGEVLVDVSGFKQPRSVSVNSLTGECWVADTNNNKIKRLSPTTGTVLETVSGFKSPQSVSVNPSTRECWVADTNNNRVKKISSTGKVSTFSGFNHPQSVSVVNSTIGECWVADTGNNRIKKLSSSGATLLTITGFSGPQSVWVVSSDGSCWIADTGNNRVVKLDAEGNEEFRISGFSSPLSIAGAP